ncbi:MAG: tRNA uridine-5-carboxymethylaminomethyl(34) synthesis GTPase MnmE [Thermoanaerobaculia bacterium]
MSRAAIDTIVAPATPVGRSALAVVRVDGPHCPEIIQALAGRMPEVRQSTLTSLRMEGVTIDQAVVVRYEAPRSFTGNDMLELTIHGNPVLIRSLVDACITLGARLAEPGEFSERAVLNGKLDLVQAESIADLINARTSLQARLSLTNVAGRLSERASAIRATLLDVISRLEAALDFAEEGYEFITRSEARGKLVDAADNAAGMLATYERGRASHDGLSAVILGRPNAGKSTLLNLLVGSDRAIVTSTPGTTRDILRETVEIGGLPVTFADTAGLRTATEHVERIGVERARAAALQADVILYLVDAAEGMTAVDEAELRAVDGERARVLVVYTKVDLARAPAGACGISAETGAGIRQFLQQLDGLVREAFVAEEGSLVNERQRLSVADCAEGLGAAIASVDAGHEEQIVLVDLYRSAAAIGALTGAITNDEILRQIFGKFCIGK